MKSMDHFGEALASYDGVAQTKFEEGETRVEANGYFEAAQFPSGLIAVYVVPTRVSSPSTEVSLAAGPGNGFSFEGHDLNGWNLKTSGQTFFSRLSWLFLPMVQRPTEISLSPQSVKATRMGASESGYTKAHFLVSNFLWHDDSDEEPEPLQIEVDGFKAEIKPVDDYTEVAQRLMSVHGVEPTARVYIESSRDEPQSLRIYSDFLDNLLYVFRLVTGNQVNWYFGEALDDRTSRPVERVHKYAATGPYSNTIRFRPLRSRMQSLIPKLNMDALTRAFFNDSRHILDKAVLKALIDQFANACCDTSFLEAQGLLASNLTELIASKYAYGKGHADVISESRFNIEILPVLKKAVEDTELPEEIREHVKNNLRGAYRNTFRRKLKSLNDGLKLGLNSSKIGRIVGIRNTLVHEGTYRSAFDDGGWFNDYQFTTWANFIALCRLLGYDGDLPNLWRGHRLEV